MIFRVAEQREEGRQQAAAAMMALGADLMQSASPPQPKNRADKSCPFFAFSKLDLGAWG
jgi:hypothetical protein